MVLLVGGAVLAKARISICQRTFSIMGPTGGLLEVSEVLHTCAAEACDCQAPN